MTNTFRACYLVAADGQSDTLLTDESQAHLPDADLTDAAVAEAVNAGLVGDEPFQIKQEDLRDLLTIGDYTR